MSSAFTRSTTPARIAACLIVCGAAVHLWFVAQAAFAECPNAQCLVWQDWPPCDEVPGCEGGVVGGEPFPCCCTIAGTGQCCQYTCQVLYCEANPKDCPKGVWRIYVGPPKYGSCGANGHCSGGGVRRCPRSHRLTRSGE